MVRPSLQTNQRQFSYTDSISQLPLPSFSLVRIKNNVHFPPLSVSKNEPGKEFSILDFLSECFMEKAMLYVHDQIQNPGQEK